VTGVFANCAGLPEDFDIEDPFGGLFDEVPEDTVP
jgi:hypothetical protein